MIILDIETIPLDSKELLKYKKYIKGIDAMDKIVAERAKYKNDIDWLKDIEGINEEICKTASLSVILARIACIGIIHKKGKARVEITFFDRESEKNLLTNFWDYIRENNLEQKTVTFNGLNFDLPFLYFRSMVNSIEVPWHDFGLRKFTSFPHFDLMQSLSFWNAFKFVGLDYFAMAFGYDVDPETCPNGSMVSKWWGCGEDSRIQSYNLEDCRKTAFLYNKVYKYYPQAPKP